MDEECLRSIQESSSLAEHFHNIVEDCKVDILNHAPSSMFYLLFTSIGCVPMKYPNNFIALKAF